MVELLGGVPVFKTNKRKENDLIIFTAAIKC